MFLDMFMILRISVNILLYLLTLLHSLVFENTVPDYNKSIFVMSYYISYGVQNRAVDIKYGND